MTVKGPFLLGGEFISNHVRAQSRWIAPAIHNASASWRSGHEESRSGASLRVVTGGGKQ